MRTNLLATFPATFPFVDTQPWLITEPALPALARREPGERTALAPRTSAAVRRLVVGASGTSSAADAVAVASTIARRHGAAVDVVSVFEPGAPYPPPAASQASPPVEPRDRPAADAQLLRVRRLLHGAAAGDAAVATWPVHLEVGQAAARIEHAARQLKADLIVLGRGRRPGEDPWLLDRTALRVAVSSTTPVLAVAPGCPSPRHLLLAVGLDELSLHVARAVRRLFPDLERIDLVHVRAPDHTSDDERHAHLDRVALVLGYPPERMTRTILDGMPAASLLDHAERTQPDCIASGLHGVTVAERSLARNLSLHLLDRAGMSVLIVPG